MRDKHDLGGPSEVAWAAAIHSATDAQALAVGTAAFLHSRFDEAVDAFERARTSLIDEIGAIGEYNKGVVLGVLGRSDEEIAVYDELVARVGDSDEPALRQVVELAREARSAGSS